MSALTDFVLAEVDVVLESKRELNSVEGKLIEQLLKPEGIE